MPSNNDSMKTNKLEKYESKVESEPSPEQIKQAQEMAVNLIMNVYERMPKDNIQPVKESFQELARQAKTSVIRQSTIIQTEKPSDFRKKPTLIDTGNDTKIITDIYSDLEKEILEKIKNAP